MKRPNAPGVDQFQPDLAPEEVERLWQGLDGAARRRTHTRLVRIAVVSSAVVAGLISLVASWSPDPKPLTAQGAVMVAGLSLPLERGPVQFDDGSQITTLGPRPAQLEVITSRPDRFVTILREGSVSVEVTPGGPRAWVIETDLASIEVVGTAFDVIRGSTSLEVKVRHGTVVVSGERVGGRVQRVTAGQSVRVEAESGPKPSGPSPESTPAPAAAAPVPTPPSPAPATAASATKARSPKPAPPRAEAPTTRDEPKAGAPPEHAPPTASPAPNFEAVLDHFAELEAQGEPIAAEIYLRQAIQGAPGGAEAATLSFELGRWLSGQPGRAADAALVLSGVDRPGAPPELVEAARALRERARSQVRSD